MRVATKAKGKSKSAARGHRAKVQKPQKPKGKPGRPTVKIDLKQVERLAEIHCTDIEIAAVLGCSTDTLLRRKQDPEFADAIKKGRAKGNESLRRSQFETAKTNPTMQIWLGKQWLDQKDKVENTNWDIDVSKLSDEQLAAIAAGKSPSGIREAAADQVIDATGSSPS